MRRAKYAPPEDHRRVTLAEIAREIDRTPDQTQKLLDSLVPYGIRPRIRSNRNLPITWDAAAIDVVKAMIAVPHRPVGKSWLDDYLGDTRHERLPRGPSAPRPPRP